MKVDTNNRKAVIGQRVSNRLHAVVLNLRLTKRFVALLLITALLMPIVYFADWQKASAQSLSSSFSFPPISVPAAAPPEQFYHSSSDGIQAATVSTFTSLGAAVVNASAPVVNFFKAPAPPLGFETAQTVSPASAMLSSINSQIASFFGFFAPASASAKKAENTVENRSENNSENEEAETAEAVRTESENAAGMPLAPPAGSVSFDFDGDGKADIARRRPSNNEWQVKNSSNGSVVSTVISASGQIAPADYDGNGVTDQAVFTAASGTWTISGQTTITGFGQTGDIPVSGNYAGDGRADAAVFRPSSGTWYVREAASGTVSSVQFGATGDVPVAGNYDGDSFLDYAVYRPSNGSWYVLRSSAGFASMSWGISSDIPVPADYDGDGKTDYGVYRGSSGTWFVYYSNPNLSYTSQVWGNYGDQPAPADHDGDGKADFTVWRPTTGVWHLLKSSNSAYEYQTLGAKGDTAVSSAYLKQIGAEVFSYDFMKTRLSPKNATGGTNLYSRNFSWSSGLVGLPGRAGLDAGFGISYNSLVWTKQTNASNNTTMVFDADAGNVSPGFRFGFPVIEPSYYDGSTGKFTYLMVAPSGARTEFRQTPSIDSYETVDSSYSLLKINSSGTPLDPVENTTLTIFAKDGTQMSYEWKAGAYRCSKIKDTNGNYIDIMHNAQGLLTKVKDTLEREINVNYDAELYPVSITQNWKDNNGLGSTVTHTWATFTYEPIYVNPIFDSAFTIHGPSGNAPVKALKSIVRPSGNSTYFYYNDYGQVKEVRDIAADSQAHVLSKVRTNLETVSGVQTDCPRLMQTKVSTENFNGGGDVVINNYLTPNQPYSVDSVWKTGTEIKVQMDGHPHEAVTKTFVEPSGWREGLPILTEDWANEGLGLVRKRWTWTQWAQDDESLSYVLNPRVEETKIGDETNTKRTNINYYMTNQTASYYGAVSEVIVYGADQTTEMQKEVTEYVVGNDYLFRHILGLPSKKILYARDENNALTFAAVQSFGYDGENFTHEANQNIPSVVQHDNVNYSSAFVKGRANLTSITRHDVTGQTAAVTTKIRYDIAGSVVAQIDPLSRKTAITYADSFNDTTTSRNTYAYPTTLTDPAGYTSTVKYRHDIGVNVEAKSPDLNATTSGKKTTRTFDVHGRLERQTLVNSGAYTRYEYPANQTHSKVFTTVTDANDNNVVDAADEVLTEGFFDGAGRTIKSRTPMTFNAGNAATWIGQQVKYDVLGRVIEQSVPTEVDANWSATSSDAIRGWQWTSQEYDWKGRVIREIGLDNIDRKYSYEGCGCAGGEIATVQGELVDRDDASGTARRTQKVYADILGRTYKTQVMNWDGTPYMTTVNTFNGRDQVVSSRQYAGTESSSTFQETTMTYDGHGRLKTSHAPQQEAGKTMSYEYYPDDRPQSVTDGRGASSAYTYNSRGLVERIDYSLPDAATNFPTINPNAPPSSQPYLSWTTFGYDPAGNRTNMTDSETGTTNYDYDQLSRMIAEHKQLRADWSIPTHNFDINYTYNLIGQLKSVTDPFGQKIEYATDKAGKLEQITGTAFGANSTNNNQPVTNYINDIDYRAWGAAGKIDYGNGMKMTQAFDNRLNLSEYKLEKPGEALPYVQKSYQYYNDNRLRFADNGDNALMTTASSNFDRSYKYDFMGRLTAAKSGAEANGNPTIDRNQIPYKQDYAYNTFGNVTSRTTFHWTQADNQTHSWTNNRESTWSYDADGRLKQTPKNRYYYDARGAMVMSTFDNKRRVINHLDGEGKAARQDRYTYSSFYNQYQLTETVYQIYSSVLGSLLTEVTSTGTKKRTFVYGMDGVVALQQYTGTSQEVRWEHTDPSNATYLQTGTDGATYNFNSWAELDPLGSNVGYTNPYNEQNAVQNAAPGGFGYGSWGDPFGSYRCMIDWMERPCSDAAQVLSSGAGVRYDGPQFRHDGNAWGQFQCPAGGACGYYYHYDYEFPDPDSDGGYGYGQNIYYHPANVDRGPFFFDLNRVHSISSQPPDVNSINTPSIDPCAGNKGTIDPNQSGYPQAGIEHVSDRHIAPQAPNYIGQKSFFTFSWFFTKGRSSSTKDERKNIVLDMLQGAFENGAVNRLSGGDFTYSYAPHFQTPKGEFAIDFIGVDHRNNNQVTNVRTVVLRIRTAADCQNPILITGYPGLARPLDRVNGNPVWKPRTLILPF